MLSAIDSVCLPYFIKLGFRVSVFPSFPAGGECPWGEHSTFPHVFQSIGAPWVVSRPSESLGCAHSPLWQLKALGDSSLPSRCSRRTHTWAVMHMSSSWLHSLPSMVFEGLG